MKKLKVAVIGAGSFGCNHIRVIEELGESVTLAGVWDTDEARCRHFKTLDDVIGSADCAIVATPTVTHEAIASRLLEAGLDVLVEKPIAATAAAGERLERLASQRGRILQVGHLERFNPAVTALEQAVTLPLFFEVHRLSVFTPRSLDIDVVLDLMIHDLDIVLSFTREMPVEVRAAGISVLSPRVDIANVRLSFASGCIANLTASRISTEKVRKLRLFQPGEYISIDYARQDAFRLAVQHGGSPAGPAASVESQINFNPLPVSTGEPLQLELQSFFDAVRTRSEPRVTASQATAALAVAEAILDKIKEHSELVSETVRRHRLA